MYTTYESEQFMIEHVWGFISGPHMSPPKPLPDPTPKPWKFKPSKLIRVDDMKVIPGAEVQEGYCALSYSWNWSGDMIEKKDNKGYKRVDNAKHQIIGYSSRHGRKKRTTRNATFEGVIEQICRDFNIRYIWYDQMCIDQTNETQKQIEIKQMHSVYRHAECTVVLIPELFVTSQRNGWKNKHLANIDAIQDSQWCQRAWTLEEAYMSKKLLFIGRNVHMYSDAADHVRPGLGYDEHFFYSICTKSMKWNASTVLWHARNRTSSKAHDRIFALANMFPEITSEINFSYNQRVLDLTRDFYNLIAAKDLSILCFGAPLEPGTVDNKKMGLNRRPEDISLPSWSGIDGLHLPQMGSDDMHLKTSASGEYTLRSKLFLCLKCSCTTALLESSYKGEPPMTPTLEDCTHPYDDLAYRNSRDEQQIPPQLPDLDTERWKYSFFPDTNEDSIKPMEPHQAQEISYQSNPYQLPTSNLVSYSQQITQESYPYHLPTQDVTQISNPYPPSSQINCHYPIFPQEPASNPFQIPTSTPNYPSFPDSKLQHMPMPEPQHFVYPVMYNSLTFVPAAGESIHYETFMKSYGLKVTHWLPIKKIDGVWTPTTASTAHRSGGYLSLVDDNCTQCLILSGLRFRSFAKGVTALPVVKNNGVYYKSIGLCFLTDHIMLDYGHGTEQSIVIQ